MYVYVWATAASYQYLKLLLLFVTGVLYL